MAIRYKDRSRKHEIDISGEAGNTYALMAQATSFAKQLGIDPEPIINDMMSGNYEHLLEVFDKNFGMVCDLVR